MATSQLIKRLAITIRSCRMSTADCMLQRERLENRLQRSIVTCAQNIHIHRPQTVAGALCLSHPTIQIQQRLWYSESSEPKAPVEVTKTQISKELTLREIKRTEQSVKKEKPLVIMFHWLYAKESALSKYCQLYHQRGLDILLVKGRLMHFLWPPKGNLLADEILNFLNTRCADEETYIIHAMSIGAYLYDICMLKSFNDSTGCKFRERVIGQIFDSVVLGTYDNMSTGIGEALPGGRIMRKPIINLMNIYFDVTKKTTKDEYDTLVKFFKENPILVPTQVYYSYNDPMCNKDVMEEMIENWRKFSDFDLTVQSWEKSVHAAHLKFHEEDYLKTWNKFMDKLGITGSNE
ncbi:hypothetical protein KUTeg_002868 [Tegillarca granosa]|uniref:Uncharacterized protein n=1 Tax=Tegillarca granosa TaxID=220873 RepID=A0ABQ9FQM0_TEGGR|nr:hypothetical protein KUTeg_002868 [Tegillarca granosa]